MLGYRDKIFGEITPLESLFRIKEKNPSYFQTDHIGADIANKLFKVIA